MHTFAVGMSWGCPGDVLGHAWCAILTFCQIGSAGAFLLSVPPSGRHIFVANPSISSIAGYALGCNAFIAVFCQMVCMCLHICQMGCGHASPSLFPGGCKGGGGHAVGCATTLTPIGWGKWGTNEVCACKSFTLPGEISACNSFTFAR